MRVIACEVGNLLNNFDVLGAFRCRFMGQANTQTDHVRDLATLTFNLRPHGACRCIRVIVLHLCTKFEVRRPSSSEDMTHFYLNINLRGDLDLRALDLETGALYCRPTLPQPAKFRSIPIVVIRTMCLV